MKTELKLFNKLTIIVFSILGTTFFGALLYAQNLKISEKKKYILPTIIFSIIWNILALTVSKHSYFNSIISFYIIQIIGGFILAGPFWNFHFHEIENFRSRNITGPSIALSIPIVVLVVLSIYYPKHNSNTFNYKTELQKRAQIASENPVFVQNDSIYSFYDIEIPLLAYTNFYTTKIANDDVLFCYVDYEEGRFNSTCSRIKIDTKDTLDLKSLENKFGTLKYQTCSNIDFPSSICAEFQYIDKTTKNLINGRLIKFNINNYSYLFINQYSGIEKIVGDNLSLTVINNIVLVHPTIP